MKVYLVEVEDLDPYGEVLVRKIYNNYEDAEAAIKNMIEEDLTGLYEEYDAETEVEKERVKKEELDYYEDTDILETVDDAVCFSAAISNPDTRYRIYEMEIL